MLTLIRGLPGSGKSTLARSLSTTTGALHLEADQFFVREGVYTFDVDGVRAAHSICRFLMRSMLGKGGDVIVSNTFTRAEELRGYLRECPDAHDYRVITCTHDGPNVHHVPTLTLDAMRARWEVWPGETLYDWTQGPFS